ncbi:hypothetical protein SK128_007540, partial [Halocaridina rubra]
ITACLDCELAVVILQENIDQGGSYDTFVDEGIGICKNMTDYIDIYCEGYVPLLA